MVEIEYTKRVMDEQEKVFDSVEQRLQETALAGQPLHNRLQSFRIQPPNAPKYLVKKTGFSSHLISIAKRYSCRRKPRMDTNEHEWDCWSRAMAPVGSNHHSVTN